MHTISPVSCPECHQVICYKRHLDGHIASSRCSTAKERLAEGSAVRCKCCWKVVGVPSYEEHVGTIGCRETRRLINNSPALRRLDETLWGRKKSKRSKTSSLVKKIASLPPNTPKGPRAMMQPPNPVPAPSPRKDNTLQARPGGTSTAPTPPLPKLDTVMSTPTKASDKPPQRQALSGLSPTTQTTQNNGSASSPSQQTSAGARVACKHVPAPATSKGIAQLLPKKAMKRRSSIFILPARLTKKSSQAQSQPHEAKTALPPQTSPGQRLASETPSLGSAAPPPLPQCSAQNDTRAPSPLKQQPSQDAPSKTADAAPRTTQKCTMLKGKSRPTDSAGPEASLPSPTSSSVPEESKTSSTNTTKEGEKENEKPKLFRFLMPKPSNVPKTKSMEVIKKSSSQESLKSEDCKPSGSGCVAGRLAAGSMTPPRSLSPPSLKRALSEEEDDLFTKDSDDEPLDTRYAKKPRRESDGAKDDLPVLPFMGNTVQNIQARSEEALKMFENFVSICEEIKTFSVHNVHDSDEKQEADARRNSFLQTSLAELGKSRKDFECRMTVLEERIVREQARLEKEKEFGEMNRRSRILQSELEEMMKERKRGGMAVKKDSAIST